MWFYCLIKDKKMFFFKNFVKEIGKNVGYLLLIYYLKFVIGICYILYYIVILKKVMVFDNYIYRCVR